jgi:hypothetical protein
VKITAHTDDADDTIIVEVSESAKGKKLLAKKWTTHFVWRTWCESADRFEERSRE